MIEQLSRQVFHVGQDKNFARLRGEYLVHQLQQLNGSRLVSVGIESEAAC